ncbi:uncharacterized protein L203_100415 [Cryptococcus depauperatus CBS 7841]|uniref:Uncharacterized protein n=1 Tax=Cryptococcus depauperatus CBS 7841 TaxID=1295531 RepID=A0A1E3HZN1_9TREE|nr:signal recognition particle subunit SRP72 [Cryptococcus depauperatus CBS 7841]
MSPKTQLSQTNKHKNFIPKPPRSVEDRLRRLYRSLADQIEDGYFENAIKTCKKIMVIDPSAQAAFQTLLFLHLQTDDYSAALALLENTTSEKGLEFERSYCLYRLHREKEALNILKGLKTKERKYDHLNAQILYRLGEYQQAQEKYEDLLADCDSSSPEHADILTNLSATSTHYEFDVHGYRSHLTTFGATDDTEHLIQYTNTLVRSGRNL